MATTTKRKFLPTLVVIAAGLTLWALIPDEILGGSRNRGERLLELKVSFEPSPRRNAIKIGYSVGGGDVQGDEATESPWTKRIPVARNVGVTLFAEQPDVAHLECSISEVTSTGMQSLIWDVTDAADPYPHSVVCAVRR